MMSPLGMTMIFKAVPARERNTVMGLYGLPLMLAPVLGRTLGGYIVEYVDWRVIFTLNVPVGIVGLFMGWRLLRESERVKGLKFDLRGFLLSAVAFSSLLLVLSDAETEGWTSPGILARVVIGGVALVGWIWVELTDQQPLLELRLFKDRTFTLAMLVNAPDESPVVADQRRATGVRVVWHGHLCHAPAEPPDLPPGHAAVMLE